jgi:hypothetical protein
MRRLWDHADVDQNITLVPERKGGELYSTAGLFQEGVSAWSGSGVDAVTGWVGRRPRYRTSVTAVTPVA